ncbi:hypothetical protein VFPPC_06501 [Pochonia chlamydosporia 170]|uniref:Heterokaryon incompatibility domain-containing protein n=1 Tax=Pochonia chlamydosporia 170 TaxID=1380566 RepID=A0A179FK73_METCM|nr:hypothetical protein VFPPC_06501 [Pochonia chlamydosporia 170]OAQ65399.2 hypothetical protein VFPPC_06501 [Pochonia chlamydosporia 170]
MNHLDFHGCPQVRVSYVLTKDEGDDIQSLLLRSDFCFNDFKAFPEQKKWKLHKNGMLETKLQPGNPYGAKPRLLQAWLFFGLITCVMRTKKSLFHFGDLVASKGGSRHLQTDSLPEKLQYWHDWMKNNIDGGLVHSRLIEADKALQLARKVIRANCLESGPASEVSEQDTPVGVGVGVGASAKTPNKLSPKSQSAGENGGRSSENEPKVDEQDRLFLCLMALGETLSAVKLHVIKDLGLCMNDWLTFDDEGWGPPSYVLKEMKENKWCPRTRKVLLGQLGPSAILLSAALKANRGISGSQQHGCCTADECVQLPGPEPEQEASTGQRKVAYPPQHYEPLCDSGGKCRLLGPDMGIVTRILREADSTTEDYEFPIFRISMRKASSDSGERDHINGITVERWAWEDSRSLRTPNFATISHIWSQGMGNEGENKLYACQLRLILQALEAAGVSNREWQTETFSSQVTSQQIKDVNDDEGAQESNSGSELSEPFWMDTFAIPVKEQDGKIQKTFEETKKRAIRQIYPVFNSATCTIVIDKDLCRIGSDSAIMRILTSAWMRRMWTLQEAFLSRRLRFVFQARGGGGFMLEDLDELIADMGGATNPNSVALRLSVTEFFKRKLYQNLMGEDREIRNRKDHPIEVRGSQRLAVQPLAEDEVLALSTLLNLDYKGTIIERAGEIAKESNEEHRRKERANMMKEFLILIHRSYQGSIPSGLIFLPGERLSAPAFGWAPRTWLCGQDEDHPYPLNMAGRPTELHEEGLLVHPGILLHGIPGRDILKSSAIGLVFPTDRYLTEWYKIVNSEDDAVPEPETAVKTDPPTETYAMGVILSRPRPLDEPPEIGLLVEIHEEKWRRKEPERINRKIYRCQIIRRVLVSRVLISSPAEVQLPMCSGASVTDPNTTKAIGEVMPDDTLWFVDGQPDDQGTEMLRPPRHGHSSEDTTNPGDSFAPVSLDKPSISESTPFSVGKPSEDWKAVLWYHKWPWPWVRPSQPK